MPKLIQCKHIPDQEVMDACNDYHYKHHLTPDRSLAHKYPPKVILKKMEQMVRRGLITYQSSLQTAWVVKKRDK